MSVSEKEVKVDTKEPEARTEEYEETFALIKHFFPNAIQIGLVLGDIVYGRVGFELKTWGDFINSIMDRETNRFRNQCYNMHNNPEVVWYYVIYGKWSEINEYSDININAVLGAIASINARYNIKTLIMPSKKYAIYTIYKIIEKAHDDKTPEIKVSYANTEQRAIGMLSAIDGVGSTKALPLLEYFGDIRATVNATLEDLMEVKGVGKVTAKNIVDTVSYYFNTAEVLAEKEEQSMDEEWQDELQDYLNDDDIQTEVKKEGKPQKEPQEEIQEEPQEKAEEEDDNREFQRLKKVVQRVIELYIKRRKHPISLDRIDNAIKKYSKSDILQALRDLEIECVIWQIDEKLYDLFPEV